jgi:hypothetical protein
VRRTKSGKVVALIAYGLYAATALGEPAHDACVTAYMGTLSRYSQTDVVLVTLKSLHTQLCSSASSTADKSMSASLESTIKQIPVVGNWASNKKVTNNSEFCRAFNEDSSLALQLNEYTSIPVANAQQNFNQCMSIANGASTAITHTDQPGQVAISINKYDVRRLFSVQGVSSRTFACQIPGVRGALTPASKVQINEPQTIMCTRAPNDSGPAAGAPADAGAVVDAIADKYYEPDEIAIGTSEGTAYTISVERETIYGPSRQSDAKATISRLEPLATRAPQLENSILNDKLEILPFYQTSGPNRGGVSGVEFGWYDFGGKDATQIAEIVKNRMCPDAVLAKVSHVTSISGNCCGKRQWVVVCSYADPDIGK